MLSDITSARARIWTAAFGVCALFAAPGPTRAEEALAAQGPPLDIEIFVSSRTDACFEPGDIPAIKALTSREQSRVNATGGISGRPIRVTLHDNMREDSKAVGDMRDALAKPEVLGMIGHSNATRSKAVFDALGGDILKSGIPFISDISVNAIFSAFPNVYTTRASQDADSVPVLAKFARQLKFAKPAYLGLRDAVASSALGDGLKAEFEGGFVADVRVASEDEKPVEKELIAAIAEIKEKRPDLLFLTIGTANVAQVMQQLVAEGVTPALFIGGRPELLPEDVTKAYPNAIYSLIWDRPPELFNNRVRHLITPATALDWMFEGSKNATAPGWAKGECKPRAETDVPDPFNGPNLRAISIGSQYADMVALIAEAARDEARSTDVAKLRRNVLSALKSRYAAGRGAFVGSFDNWSFVPATRSATRDPFVVILPQGLGRTQLAPHQFLRSKDGTLRQMETLYADVDLIKAHRFNENDKTFFAEFYLSMRNNPGASIEKLEFSNAYLDPENGGRQLSIDVIHPGGASAIYPDAMKIYKVSGRFLFNPELALYPFDSQQFSIDIQPKNGETSFIVQPPPLELRDQSVIADGWEPAGQYVGYDEDFIPVVDAYTHQPSIVPFYKASFVWLMQRQTTDYFLRVVVPLAFILFVAYLSIFIPRSHFEAIVTIQVTALLSAVALYLSLPKLESDTATLSDRAFVFAYMILSVMIGISILRINPVAGKNRYVVGVLNILHILAIPACVAFAAFYVYGLSTAGR